MWGGGWAAHAACRKRLDWSLSARQPRAECTSNISSMVVTWDVSKFSGWLNTFANCRVKEMGAYNIEGRWGDAGCKARAECTLNIATMLVTRDVSKFNGWLNAFAPCQESRGGGG